MAGSFHTRATMKTGGTTLSSGAARFVRFARPSAWYQAVVRNTNGAVDALADLLGPVFRVHAAPLDDGSHRAQREDSPAVKWNDNLFCGGDIAPLLVAACRPGECETVTAENRNDLVSRQARRSALTQPLPRPASRSETARSRRARGRVESPLRFLASPPLPFRRPKCIPAAQGRLRRSFRLPGHTPGPHETSCLQYSARPLVTVYL